MSMSMGMGVGMGMGMGMGTSMRHRVGRRVGLAAVSCVLALAALLAGGCKVVTARQSPSAMKVSIEIQDFSQGQSHVTLRFATQSNDTVEFVSGETVACDGVFLRYALGFYVGDVPKQPAGGSYSITYTPASGSASGTPGSGTSAGANSGSSGPITLTVPVVDAPVTVSQPASGATVAIPTSAPLVVQYTPVQLANTSIMVVANDSRLHLAAALPQAESGSYSIGADQFSDFQAGPGLVSVTRITDEAVAAGSFGGVTTQFKNVTQVPVTWQAGGS